MEISTTNSINYLFKCIGISLVIISLKVDIVGVPTLKVAQTIFYTFVNNWILATWYALPLMFLYITFYLMKEKLKQKYNL